MVRQRRMPRRILPGTHPPADWSAQDLEIFRQTYRPQAIAEDVVAE
jgi:hypothetical protein